MVSRIVNPRGVLPRPRQARSSAILVAVCLGVVAGLFLAKWIDRLDEQRENSSLLTISKAQDRSNPDAEGWGAVHVFYGQASALLADNPSQQWFSQVKQDEIVLDLLADATGGIDKKKSPFFVDLAANDAKEFSNTLALEQHGWDGLCIEPNSVYWYGLSHRRCTVVGALVADTVSPVQVKFRGVYGGIVGKMDEQLANRKREPNSKTETRFSVPFPTVLRKFKVPKTIDYLSLDVEGAEYLVMSSFPFEEYTIRLLTIERPSQELSSLLEAHGYLMLKKLVWWGETLWAHKSTGLSPLHPKVAKIVTEEATR